MAQRTKRLTWLVCVVLGLSGCAGYELGASGLDTADAGAAGGESDDGGTGDAIDTTGYWWKLSGLLTVAAGELQPGDGVLRIAVIDDAGAAACELNLDLVSATSEAPPDPSVLGWWSVTAGGWLGDCGVEALPSPVPDSLMLGIGAMHPEIEVMLPSVDALSPLAYGQLNSAYARLKDDGPIYAYGVAGEAAAFAGSGAAVVAAPVPDGDYELQAIFAFDY